MISPSAQCLTPQCLSFSQHVPLAVDEIHLWLVELDQPPVPLADLAATLTPEECKRAERFRFPEHRDRFVAGRGLLRELLGAYLDRPAAALCFEQGAHGKPALAGKEADAGVYFNLSHSGHRAMYGVARRELGVDLEHMDRTVTCLAVAERICTPREWALFQALPEERVHEAFITCWTRKEAIAKATGEGLASRLRSLEVCFPEKGEPEGRKIIYDNSGQPWSVLDLPLDKGWAGALVAVGVDWCWRGYRWV